MFEKLIYDFEKKFPSYNCQAERYVDIKKEEALRDYQLDWFRRNGDWNCYC